MHTCSVSYSVTNCPCWLGAFTIKIKISSDCCSFLTIIIPLLDHFCRHCNHVLQNIIINYHLRHAQPNCHHNPNITTYNITITCHHRCCPIIEITLHIIITSVTILPLFQYSRVIVVIISILQYLAFTITINIIVFCLTKILKIFK